MTTFARIYFMWSLRGTHIAFCLLLCSSTVFAQGWTQLNTPFTPTGQLRVPYSYFVTSNYGFVGGFRTTDYGNSWTAVVFPGTISQLAFISPARGYAAVTDPSFLRGGIFETIDSGHTWTQITSGQGGYIRVYAVNHKIFALQDSLGNCQLLQTSDDGKNWERPLLSFHPTIPTPGLYYSNDQIVGNNESLVAFLASTEVFYSTDQGSSWHRTPTSIPYGYNTIALLPNSCTMLEMVGNNFNTYDSVSIFRSSPPFSNWQRTLDSQEVASWFAVNGCGAYAFYAGMDSNQTLKGLIQSTDQGGSWQFVPTPRAPEIDDVNPLSPGVINSIASPLHSGIVYFFANDLNFQQAFGGPYEFYRWTDSALLLEQPSFQVSTDIRPSDTVYICDTGRLKLSLTNTSCSWESFDSLSITGLDSGIYYTQERYHSCGTFTDTVLVTIVPKVPGTHTLALTFHFWDDNYAPFDTSFQTTIVYGATSGILDLTKRSINFGTQSLCAPVVLKDSFAILHACEAIKVDSIVLHPDSSRFTDFSFKPIRNFIPSNDSTIYFPISFKPSMAATEQGSIVIVWNDGESEHWDTIRVQGAGVEDTRSFSIQPPSVTVRMCDSSAGWIYFTNTTCGFLELDSLALPAGLALPLAANLMPQLPLYLNAGAEDSLVVTILPGTEGAGTAPLHLGDTTLVVPAHMLYTDKGGTTAFDTTISVSVHVERGPAAALLSDTVLNFGTVSACDSATLPIVLMSTGCDTLSGIGYRVQGVGYRVSGNENPLPIGESDTLLVTYIPTDSTNPSSASLVITSNVGTETVPLRGTSSPGLTSLSTNTSQIDFGSLYECESRDTTLVLRDSGCSPLTIDSAILSGTAYTSPQSYPLVVRPGDSASLGIHLTAGSDMAGNITFYSNATSGSKTKAVTLHASSIPPTHLGLTLSPTQSATSGQNVTFDLILTGDTGLVLSKIQSVTFDLTHDDDILSFLSSRGVQINRGTIINGMETDTLQWNGSGNGSMGDTIGTLTFQVYLSDSAETPLSFSNISLGTPGIAAPCVASLDSAGSMFSYVYRCGDHAIQDVLNHVPFKITSVVPNPASQTIMVTVEGCSGTARYELFDALGRCVMVQNSSRNSETLNILNLPSGMYLLRVLDGRSESFQRLVIQR